MPQLDCFHEVRFPTDIAIGASGGPERRTEIVALGSGHEQRNARWQDSRRHFEAGYGVKSLDDLYTVIAFFEQRRGALYGFRYKDLTDWKSCPPQQAITATDQIIATGDGAETEFSLLKTYGTGTTAYARQIVKPVGGAVMIAVNGATKTEGTHYTLDTKLGKITFLAGHIPAAGNIITAGYEFDVPVRFASDQLTVNIAAFEAGNIPSIPLIEIKQ